MNGTVPDLSIPDFVSRRYLRVLLIGIAAFAQASHAAASVVSVGNASGQSQMPNSPTAMQSVWPTDRLAENKMKKINE